jgi:hypothetical protein
MSILNIIPARSFLNSGNITFYNGGNVAIGKTTATYNLDISGDLNTDNKIKENGNDLVPSGLVIMWYGSIASIPAGWTLCNGTNGAPNLSDFFIIPGNSDSNNFVMTNITGTNTQRGGTTDTIILQHNHTVTMDISGEHTHIYSRNSTGGGIKYRSAGGQYYGYSYSNTSTAGAHSHTYTTDVTGSSAVNANIPPYIALAYIMKL